MTNDPPLFLLSGQKNEPDTFCISSLSKKEWMGEVQRLCYDPSSEAVDFSFPPASFLSYLSENLPRLKKILSTATKNRTDDFIEIPFTVHRKESEPEVLEGAALVFTDGACMTGSRGGWAAVIRYGHGVTLLSGAERNSSSNRMELKAAVKALEKIHLSLPVILHSDSRYVLQGIDAWLENWKFNDYMTAQNREAKNRDLWERMAFQKEKRRLALRQISSSQGISWHRRCHNLSRHAALYD